jgi:hypothetical protein
MKKLLIMILLPLYVWANTGTLIEIINENILKLQTPTGIKKVHLAGIELIGNSFKPLNASQKEILKQKVQKYMSTVIAKGEKITYHVVSQSTSNIQYVWIQNQELNYKLIRDGFATLKTNDYNTPSLLQMRMKRALAFAQKKNLGLWKEEKLVALCPAITHCNTQKSIIEQRQAQLQEHISKLPKSARLMLESEHLASK